MQIENKYIKRFVCLTLAVLASACSTVPEKLKVPAQTSLVSYQQASQNAQKVVGEKARWGGVIAKVKHKKEFTMLELVQYETYSSSKPIPGDDSLGRFRVYVEGFLEPKIYKEGRLVSALGTIAKPEQGQLEEQVIWYPVLKESQIYLWPKESKVRENDYWRDPFWPYSSRWYWNRYHHLHPYYIPKSNNKRSKKSNASKRKMIQ
ncbi:Slp family lipoprotein [Catenovulum adriaticum]|uniref:Slp family lipoprotein n=1 Tax=Catenovulum adriaticum TaxID=2984846 RepID=A0ABY7AHJ6_9ALTE|nr:Slp/YeaY family lipoprotein [Catenovulum sp. TS8]WAJ69088.1 Slp family lipoprotein [Catenovulum sp. TS8]